MRKTIVMAAVAACMFVSNVFAQRIKGSDTCLPLSQTEAENFINKNKSAKITVTGGGSGVGISALMEGTTDIAMSSRKMKFDEKVKLQEAKKSTKEVVIAYDALAVVVHPSNKVSNLTREQLEGIFTGKIKNWKEVGGPDEPITLVTRPKTSGTRALFSKYAMGGAEEAANKSLETDNSGLLVQSVAQNKGAIGYVALPYLTKNDTVATVAIDGVAPTLENTYSGKYNVWGYEHVYTSKNPKAAVKAFLDCLLSADYGKELGYGVSSKMQVKDTAHD